MTCNVLSSAFILTPGCLDLQLVQRNCWAQNLWRKYSLTGRPTTHQSCKYKHNDFKKFKDG